MLDFGRLFDGLPYTEELLGGGTQAELPLGGEAVGTGTPFGPHPVVTDMSRVAAEDREAPGFTGEAGVSSPVGCTRGGEQATLLLGPDTVVFFFFFMLTW